MDYCKNTSPAAAVLGKEHHVATRPMCTT